MLSPDGIRQEDDVMAANLDLHPTVGAGQVAAQRHGGCWHALKGFDNLSRCFDEQ